MYETDKGTGCIGEFATSKAPQTVHSLLEEAVRLNIEWAKIPLRDGGILSSEYSIQSTVASYG
jgi:hypothetical protein